MPYFVRTPQSLRDSPPKLGGQLLMDYRKTEGYVPAVAGRNGAGRLRLCPRTVFLPRPISCLPGAYGVRSPGYKLRSTRRKPM